MYIHNKILITMYMYVYIYKEILHVLSNTILSIVVYICTYMY